MHWSGAPDVGAFVLLSIAFASLIKRSPTRVAKVWMIGWAVIVLHFAAELFSDAPGVLGQFAEWLSLVCLVWAACFFMGGAAPYKNEVFFRRLGLCVTIAVTVYASLLFWLPGWQTLLTLSAASIGLAPLIIAIKFPCERHRPLGRATVALYVALSIFLLLYASHPNRGLEIASHGLLLALYIGCSFHFWYAYPRSTMGAFVTITGFLCWAASYLFEPLLAAGSPALHMERELWNMPMYVVAVGMLLLQLENQIEHNKYLALHDDLTGLPNRRLFHDRLAGALERARRNRTVLALLLVDLNDFKKVNDQYGHAAGDRLLRHVSDVFISRIRKSDTAARTGGDEFCIILEAPTSRADAERVGQSLLNKLQEPIPIGRHSTSIGASIGLALYPEDATDTESLCIAADYKMYAEKRRWDLNSKTPDAIIPEHFMTGNPEPPPTREGSRID